MTNHTGGDSLEDKKIFRLYEVNPHNILEVVDEAHSFFHMKSESKENLW